MKCKVGDLVMVVKCPLEANTGRTGTIDKAGGFVAYDGIIRDWIVLPSHSFTAMTSEGRLVDHTGGAGFVDDHLMPIPPLPDDEELEDKAPTDHKELQNA